MKILDIRDTHEIGGPGKTILETFRAIDSSRFDLHLAVFVSRAERADTPFLGAARDLGMPVHVIRGFNQYDPQLVFRLARLVRRLRIDVVHAHDIQSDVVAFLASALHHAPTITTAHGWIANGPKGVVKVNLDKLVMRGFARVIAVSRLIHQELVAAGVPSDRVCLLHNAIVVERYVRTGERGQLARLLGRPVTRPVIASIGRLSLEKGHADLLDALGMVAARGSRFTAVLAGDGPERAALLGRARDLGLLDSVHFPGYVDRPQILLEESDLMVLPSHTEGLPNAALEAMAMGVPVLATCVGGTPEIVVDACTGRLVEPRSPERLAQGIIAFLSDPQPWKAMAERGRKLVESEYDFGERTRKLERIYAGLAAETMS